MRISDWSSDVCSSDLPSRCSATIRTLDMGKTSCGAGFNPPSESVGAADGGSGPALQEALLLQCGNQFGRVLHQHAADALGRRGVVGGLERVARVKDQVGEGDRLEWLGTGLHEVRRLKEKWVFQGEVGGGDGGKNG